MKKLTMPPTILIVFGATGDLMAKKIIPALYHLYESGKTPNKFKIIGFSRRELSDKDFRDHIIKVLRKHKDTKKKRIDKAFLRRLLYTPGTFEKIHKFKKILNEINTIDKKWGICANKLFYLAVPPRYYEIIFKNLSASGLTDACSPKDGWTRILVEKPFGKNLETAKKLDNLLTKLFKPEQIYPIDHYLAKEMMQSIFTFRFSNNLFEKSWNRNFIERINIRVYEKIGITGRGTFYDGVGALRDVGQNHLIQILALITMKNPGRFDDLNIRRQRTEVLKNLKTMSANQVKKQTFRGQYQGYEKEKDVDPKSNSETYFNIKTELDLEQWEGVPIYLESGKRLKKHIKEIEVIFKHPYPCYCPPGKHYQNKLIFSLDPKEGITIHFWSNKPSLEHELEKRELDFIMHEKEKETHIEEYEKVLFDCIMGDQTLFVSPSEIKAMWRFIDPIEKAWQKNAVPLIKYEPGFEKIQKKAKKIEKDIKEIKKEIGVIGLGKMGKGIARQLIDKGWQVTGYNRSPKATKELAKEGLKPAYQIKELVENLKPPRLVWLMVPAGKPVNDTLFGRAGLTKFLEKGDYIVDGGNSFFKNTMKRYPKVVRKGIHYIDAGVSGGPAGARNGACIMIGGYKKDYQYLESLFSDLTIDQGYQFFPGPGAGHFVKMVHNGIEYGMMQAMAEGFDVMRRSKFKPDLKNVARVYRFGSVIESRLMDWLYEAFKDFGNKLDKISGAAAESGEGDWTIKTAHQLDVADKVIHESLRARKRSQKKASYQGKIISALRNKFGGHDALKKKG